MDPNTSQPVEDPEVDKTGTDDVDYKALYEQAQAEAAKWKEQSRKQESRAKHNAGAAKDLEGALQQLSDLNERLGSIESENSSLKAAAERRKVVAKVAKATGVPEAIVSSLSGNDEKALSAAATAIAEAYKTPGGAPRVPEAGQFPRGKQTGEGDDMRTFVRQLFGRD